MKVTLDCWLEKEDWRSLRRQIHITCLQERHGDGKRERERERGCHVTTEEDSDMVAAGPKEGQHTLQHSHASQVITYHLADVVLFESACPASEERRPVGTLAGASCIIPSYATIVCNGGTRSLLGSITPLSLPRYSSERTKEGREGSKGAH